MFENLVDLVEIENFINPFSYGMLGLGSKITKSKEFWPFGEAGAAGYGATVLKKLANVGILRNAGLHRRTMPHITHGPSEGKDCQDYADGTGPA